jgi:hypothetical protein
MYYITSAYQDNRINCLRGSNDQLMIFKTFEYVGKGLNQALNHRLLANLPHHIAIKDIGDTGWTHDITINIPIEFEQYFRYCELGELFGFTDDSPVEGDLYELSFKNRLINESHVLNKYDYITTHQLLHTHSSCSMLLSQALKLKGLDLYKIGLMYGIAGSRIAVQNVLLDKLIVYKDEERLSLENLVDLL